MEKAVNSIRVHTSSLQMGNAKNYLLQCRKEDAVLQMKRKQLSFLLLTIEWSLHVPYHINEQVAGERAWISSVIKEHDSLKMPRVLSFHFNIEMNLLIY